MPDGTSNNGLAIEGATLRRREYDPQRAAQQHADQQAVVDGGLFADPDVGVCPQCGDPAPECALCNTCATEDRS